MTNSEDGVTNSRALYARCLGDPVDASESSPVELRWPCPEEQVELAELRPCVVEGLLSRGLKKLLDLPEAAPTIVFSTGVNGAAEEEALDLMKPSLIGDMTGSTEARMDALLPQGLNECRGRGCSDESAAAEEGLGDNGMREDRGEGGGEAITDQTHPKDERVD